MNLPRVNSIIVLVFALLYPACVPEESKKFFEITLYSETNQRGKSLTIYREKYQWVPCETYPNPIAAKSLSVRMSGGACFVLTHQIGCVQHIFRVFPGIAINNDLTSVNFSSFAALGRCEGIFVSGLLFHNKTRPSATPFYRTDDVIENYTGCQNLPDFVREVYVEGVELYGECANIYSDPDCKGEVFYIRPQYAETYAPANFWETRQYTWFTLQSYVSSFSPCGANWTTPGPTTVIGVTDDPYRPTASLQPSLCSFAPNIFAATCILLSLQAM